VSVTIALVAHRPHSVGHRTLAIGETFARVQFLSVADAKFFRNHLRWAAFSLVDVPAADVARPANVDRTLVQEKHDLQNIVAQLTKRLDDAEGKLAAIAAKNPGDESDNEPLVIMHPLESLPEITPFLPALTKAQITTIEHLAATDVTGLAAIDGISKTTAKKLIGASLAFLSALPKNPDSATDTPPAGE